MTTDVSERSGTVLHFSELPVFMGSGPAAAPHPGMTGARHRPAAEWGGVGRVSSFKEQTSSGMRGAGRLATSSKL